MSAKKIILVSDSIYPYHKGGKEKRIFELSNRLAKQGHDVHIFTMNWWQGDKIKKENGVILHAVCKLVPLYTKGRRSIWQGIYYALKVFWPLLKEKFDVIEVDHMVYFHLFPCWLACKLKRKKLIVTWHEVWGKQYWLKYLGKAGYLGYLMEKISTKLPHTIISVSQLTKKRLIKYFQVPEEKIKVLPNGIDIQEKDLKSVEKKYHILFAGRLLKHKKVDILIYTIKELKKNIPNIKACIIGQGPEKERLLVLINNLGLKDSIEFNDFLEDKEFIGKIKQSKIFVSCSIREGFGIGVLEGMAYGLPAVVIEHPENASTALVENNKNGFTSVLDPEKIAIKITQILSSESVCENMPEQAMKTAQKYQWSNIINDLLEIYSSSETK